MPHRQAAAYRQRATHLRTLATEMANAPSMSLHLHASVDTWCGPRADVCATELASAQHAVRGAADDLRTRAFVFDRAPTNSRPQSSALNTKPVCTRRVDSSA
jgi:hypothetical protein